MKIMPMSIAAALCALTPTAAVRAATISTFDQSVVTAFQAGRTVIGFDEFDLPPPYYIPLPTDQYLALGIRFSANADGSTQTHVCRTPQLGHFGPTQSLPNIIGGGVTATGPQWRQSVRFDFPAALATSIGAHSDWSGSNTTLSAYASDGSLIEEVSGNQGAFMAVITPGIRYAVWRWNYDQTAAGFSLDNVTFSLAPAACLGDANCDGTVDFFDIDPFVAKIGCPGSGAGCDAPCPWQNADVDQDGDVDFFDIDPFVAQLGTTCP